MNNAHTSTARLHIAIDTRHVCNFTGLVTDFYAREQVMKVHSVMTCLKLCQDATSLLVPLHP